MSIDRSMLLPQLLAVSLLALMLAACGNHNDRSNGPPIQQGTLIEIDDGMVQGHIDGGARRFLGIPFAAPPVGDLRWRPPQPVEPWSGVLTADEISPACAQLASLTTPASGTEDCLYLNVWTPDPAPSEPLPVMLWIHGGSNTSGSTGDEVPLGVGGLFYDGRTLAETRNVVVVTTNYRLNVFGFLTHPALDSEDSDYPYSGNQALLDQQQAMRWVRDNIGVFGGDADNVTIFGESAGAFDVCYQVVSPPADGLFHRAISESGGCSYRTTTASEGRSRTESLIRAVGCDTAANTLACLREVSIDELLANSDGFGPIVDGGVIPDQPRALFDSGSYAKVPYLLGSNSDEGTLFAIGVPPVQSEEEYLAALAERYGDYAQDIAALYPVSDFASPNDALIRANGDSFLVCGTYDTARRARAGGSDVFLYNFARPVLEDILPNLQATHGAEIAFVFGSGSNIAGEDDLDIALSMEGYWSRFARSGDPNGEGAMVWPAYDDASDQRINFDVKNSVLSGFRRQQCELWWEIAAADFE